MPEPIIIESLTLVTLLLYAIDRVKIQPIFDRDPYESRRQEWKVLLAHDRPTLEQTGKKFARIAAVDASLIKLSLAAYDWAKYRKKTGAAKSRCVFDWVKGVPQQFVFTASGKLHDLKATTEIAWCAGWT